MSQVASRRDSLVHGDSGSEVVEFTLVSVLVIIVVAAVLQLALALHVRNTLISCAAEGAHLAAAEDRSIGEGEARAVSLAHSSLGSFPIDAHARMTLIEGAPGVVISMTAPVPVVGLWGFGSMTVEARAFEEINRG